MTAYNRRGLAWPETARLAHLRQRPGMVDSFSGGEAARCFSAMEIEIWNPTQ
jgi:hypothetical protein